MPKSILINLNIVLDVFLRRKGFQASSDVIQLGAEKGQVCTSAHAITTFAYLLENAKVPQAQIERHIKWLLDTFQIIPIGAALLHAALESNIRDYEDAVIEQCAVTSQAEAIITRNVKDFRFSTVPAFTPEAYLRQYK